MADFNKFWEPLKQKEGGFQNMKEDVGNYCDGQLIGTKYGVSAVNYKAFYGVCPTVSQMRNLTDSQARAIWKKTVWDRMKGDEIRSSGIAELILDATGGGRSGYLHTRQAINKTAGRRIVNETYTMSFTNDEIKALNSLDEKKFIDIFYNIRLDFFKTHVQRAEYGAGWISRLQTTYKTALSFTKETIKENPKTTVAVIGLVLIVAAYLLYKNPKLLGKK